MAVSKLRRDAKQGTVLGAVIGVVGRHSIAVGALPVNFCSEVREGYAMRFV